MKALKKNNIVHIVFSDNRVFYTNGSNVKEPFNSIDELWEFVKDNMGKEDGEKIIEQKLFDDSFYTKEYIIDSIKKSQILDIRGNIVCMPRVSTVSMPEDFVLKIIKAEESGDQNEVNKYINFWSFLSLNPDSRVRENLFWFIRKWDVQISPAGFIIAYRNVALKQKANITYDNAKHTLYDFYKSLYIDRTKIPTNLLKEFSNVCDGNYDPYGNIYTDHYSYTFSIRLGEPVRMDRELCNPNQEESCSTGLHCGAKGWLKKNNFGNVGIMVLVNPANVVAVPTIDQYGKMRCCEYFPVCIVDFDDDGNVIEPAYYNDIEYLNKTICNDKVNNEDINFYELSSCHYKSREEIYNNILQSLNNGE